MNNSYCAEHNRITYINTLYYKSIYVCFFLKVACPNILGSLETRQISDGLSGGISNTNQLYQGAIHFGVRQGSGSSYTLTLYSDMSMMDKLSFNASYSNSIFGNSSTVQPRSLNLSVLIKY